jgi:hypothetical protein
MLSQDILAKTSDELPLAVEDEIRRRTWGRVQRLRVDAADGRVVVRGAALSYYVKQLAIQAVLDALGPAGAAVAALEIEVETAPPRPPLGHDDDPGRVPPAAEVEDGIYEP